MLLLSWLWLMSCESTKDSNHVTWKQQESLMQEANRQVWMPWIVNFQEKKLAKMIFELRDQEDLSTYTYITAKNTGKLSLLCKSIWYWLPYSIQYTNPMKCKWLDSDCYNESPLPQADPNGLFMPDWLAATWVMCLDSNNSDPRPVYIENEIIVSPFKLN